MPDPFRSLDLIAQEIQALDDPNPLRDLALNLVHATRRALEQITTPRKAAELRDRVRAIEVYAKRQRATLADSNLITAERLRIERTIGAMLQNTARSGNPQFSHDGRNGKLPDGITWNDSSRWQKLAAVDDEDFEHWLSECIQTEQEISTAAALGFWSRYVQPEHAPAEDNTAPDAPEDDEAGAADTNIVHQIYCPHCGSAVMLTAAAQVLEE